MIWVRLRDHPSKQVFIKESDYDPDKHIKPSKEEEEQSKIIGSMNINQICKERSAPGMHMKIDSSRGSVMHNNKLDYGAADNLIEMGLDSAKKRIKEREKKTGYGFRKMKTGKLVPKKGNRRRK